MAEAVDLVHRRALAPDRGGILNTPSDALGRWLTGILGEPPGDRALYERALTHGSRAEPSYERLEFLGDRVLGLTIAHWLYRDFPAAPEGQLTKRFHPLVSGATCAAVARELGVAPYLRLGKQGHDDGAANSDKVLGDVAEALLGALYLDHGLAAAEAFVVRHWASHVGAVADVPQHPKSALQEWAATHRRKPPAYDIVDRTGPDHARRFTVRVSLGEREQATASGNSKQDAETAAAAALLRAITP